MKKSAIKKSLYGALLIMTPLLLSSCLSGENQISSQVQVGLELQSIDDTVRAGQDSVIFERVRLILGKSYFLQSEGDTLFFNQNAQQVGITPQSANPVLLASGTFPPATYNQIKITIPKAPGSSPGVIDAAFVEGDTRYTLIVEGKYNGVAFTYKSERVFEFDRAFQPSITVPEYNESFGFLITNDVAGWFLSGNGLLDPREPSNSTEINDNISQLFSFDIPD